MYVEFIQYLKSVDEKDLSVIDLEDIALAQALHQSHDAKSSAGEKPSFIPKLVKSWLSLDFEQLTPAFNMRLQPLLRDTLDTLTNSGLHELTPDHLLYLKSVLSILESIRNKDEKSRLLQILRKQNEAMSEALIEKSPTSGLVELLGDLIFTREKSLLTLPRTRVKTFGDVELELNGPTLKHNGNVKVLDNVPDDVMLIINNGSCYVNGYVMGSISVTDRCDVKQNIAGTAIADKGDIHARNILKRAYVVSKCADIVAENIQDPELFFAGNKIHIHKDARLGVYVAPNITIGRSMLGGEITFSEKCYAERFSPLDTRNLIIEMQNKISCDVYGRLVDPEAGRTLASINRVMTRYEHVVKMIRVLHTEIDHFADNAIIYLLGGDLIQIHIEAISRKQRRVAFLERIINGIEGLAKSTRLHLIQQQRIRQEHQEALHGADGGMNEMKDELATIKDHAELDDDLTAEAKVLDSMTLAIARREPLEIVELNQLNTKILTWQNERRIVQLELRKLEGIVLKALDNTEAANAGKLSGSKAHVLTKMIEKANTRSNKDPILQRSRSNFVQFALRTIEQRKHRMLTYKKLLGSLSEEHKQLCERLKKKYNLEPPTEEDETIVPVVTGIFDANVTLCTDKFLLDSPDPEHTGNLITEAQKSPRSFTIIDNNVAQRETQPA